MPLANPDFHDMVNSARKAADEYSPEAEESIQQENAGHRDRTRGKSKYMRKAIVRVFSLSPEVRDQYKPRNGFEEAAMALFKATQSGKSYAVSAFREVKETLGERIGSNWKDTVEQKSGAAVIVNDIPTAERKPQ